MAAAPSVWVVILGKSWPVEAPSFIRLFAKWSARLMRQCCATAAETVIQVEVPATATSTAIADWRVLIWLEVWNEKWVIRIVSATRCYSWNGIQESCVSTDARHQPNPKWQFNQTKPEAKLNRFTMDKFCNGSTIRQLSWSKVCNLKHKLTCPNLV